MQHPEKDYDQVYTAVDQTAKGWLPPPAEATCIASGWDSRFLISHGPYQLSPGQECSFTFAWVCGSDVHKQPDNFDMNFNPYNPYYYFKNLDFSDLIKNSVWASWTYDNPGFDTDGDGYRGEYVTICRDSVTDEFGGTTCLFEDTVFYIGDGIPDYRAATPPPPPVVRVLPGIDGYNSGFLKIRWNGLISETTPDVFSGELDFEGYRLYLSLSPRQSDFALISSWDKQDYIRMTWSEAGRLWVPTGPPLTLDSIHSIYGNDFDPLVHHMYNPLRIPNSDGSDSLFYFTIQDWNVCTLDDTTAIHRRFPDEPFPTTLCIDSARLYYPDELTANGEYFKYFEYEHTIKDLLPSPMYYVSVTAFDFGSPGFGLSSLESNPTLNMVPAYAQNSAAIVEEGEGLNVIVYPNPYRIDGCYRRTEGGGFEGRGQENMSDERTRAIHFTNLPHKCTIRIFSIDGDLIREIHHDRPEGHPQSMHDKWDMITRNTQEPVSGIYYYVVESEFGSQIGKIVIIM
jgi:hypothetical protein